MVSSVQRDAMRAWREPPEVEPASVGMDDAVLERMRLQLEQAAGVKFRGALLAVYRRGRCVLDAGVGLARERTGVPVEPDTLFVLFSATKGLTALALLQLHERGVLHWDEPVVKYWPEFASAVPAKASVTLRHVLSHRGGFPTGPAWLTTRFFPDRSALRRAMEEVPLRFVPGERSAYHPLNSGHVLGEVVERAAGRDCGRVLREGVLEPLGLRDLFLGLPQDASLESRIAWCYNDLDALATGAKPRSDAGDPAARAAKLAQRFGDTPELAHGFNRPETWRSVLPAAGAIGSARDLARVYAVLAQGGRAGGVELCTPEGLAAATAPVSRRGEIDATLGFAVRWGTGFHMGMYGRGSTLRSFGHAGMGGQIAFADPDRELAFAFLCNGELADDFLLWRYRLQSLAFSACT
jgi:CubicO group peptidase (beta-lactamase class C family)